MPTSSWVPLFLGVGRWAMRETTGPALFYGGLSLQGHCQTLGHSQRSHKAVHLAWPNPDSV